MAIVAELKLRVGGVIGLGGTFALSVKGQRFEFKRSIIAQTIGSTYYFWTAEQLELAMKARFGSDVIVTRYSNEISLAANDFGWNFAVLQDDIGAGIQILENFDSEGESFQVAVNSTNVTIKGGNDGTIILTPSGGNTPYTYKWDDGPTTATRNTLVAGVYYCTVTEGSGVKRYIRVQIFEPAYSPITITGNTFHVQCYGKATGWIQIFLVQGGNGNYTYKWADGVTTKDRTNLRAGIYTLTVTDSLGNTTSKSFEVKSNPEIKIVATVNEDDVSLAVSGGSATNGYTYLWNDGVTTKDRTNLAPGSYVVTVTDSIGCKQQATVKVQSFQFFFSKNPIPLQLIAELPDTKPNLTFLCEVWIEKDYLSEDFTKVAVLEQPADSNGSTTFEVQTILDAQLKPYFPEGKETILSRADSVFKRFYLRYTEKFGTPPVEGAYTQADIRYVILGGLSFEEYSRNTFFSSYLPTKKPFFTWEPVQKNVFADQLEYLFYMPDSFALGTFQVNCQVTYADNTTDTFIAFTATEVKRYELYCIPAGYTELNLAARQPSKQVASWQICVISNSQVISEVRYYTLNTNYTLRRRYFLYLNSLGGYNTLCVTGKAIVELEPKGVTLEKILPITYRSSTGEIEYVRKYAEQTLKLTTAALTPEQLQAFSDFVISESIILYRPGRTPYSYVGGVLDAKSIKVVDESETNNSVSFEFTLPTVSSYTPDL